MLPISACLISNKLNNIDRCLSSLNFVKQIIVVDTGNGDVSKIAKNRAKTLRFQWCDDFSAARNFSIENADEKWILIIDDDEIVPTNAVKHIEKCIQKKTAYNVVTKNYTRINTCTNWRPLSGEDDLALKLGFFGWFPSYKIRLFQNGLNLKFEGRVHELIKIKAESAPFYIHHLHEDVKNSEQWFEKKRYYLKLGQIKLAEKPNDPQANFELGLQFSEFHQNEQALICFKNVIEIDQNFGDKFYGNAYFEIANIYSSTNKDLAIEYLEKSIHKKPEHSPSYYNLAKIYQNKNNLPNAEQLYKKAIEICPDFAVAHNNLGNILLDMGRYNEALQSAQKTIQLNPNIYTAYQNASCALFELGNKEEAKKLCEYALSLAPKEYNLNYNIARFHYKSHNLNESIHFLKICLQLDPKRGEAYNHLAAIYIDLGLFQSAEKIFQEAILTIGNTPEIQHNYSILQSKKKRQTKKLITFNFGLGLAKGNLPPEDVELVPLSFSQLEEFVVFAEQEYIKLFNFLKEQTNDLWELRIGAYKNKTKIHSSELQKYQFRSIEEGKEYIKNYIAQLGEHH